MSAQSAQISLINQKSHLLQFDSPGKPFLIVNFHGLQTTEYKCDERAKYPVKATEQIYVDLHLSYLELFFI